MTVSANVYGLNRYTGNNVATVYPYTSKIFASSDLQVTLINNTTLAGILQTLGTHYTVSGVGEDAGGSVIFFTPPAGNQIVDLRSITQNLQPTSIRNQTKFFPETHENALDRLTRQVQDLERQVRLGFRLPDLETFNPAILLSPVNRRNKYFSHFADTAEALPELFESIGTTVLSQSVIASYLYPQTQAESNAGVTPVNYGYVSGDARRYGFSMNSRLSHDT